MTEKQITRRKAASAPEAQVRARSSTTVAKAAAPAATTAKTSRAKVSTKAAEANAAPAAAPKAPPRARAPAKAREVAAAAMPAESPATAATPEHRVAVAAYFRAQARGFAPGHELEDWYAAEAQFRSEPETAAAA